jgi:hypothetical protein
MDVIDSQHAAIAGLDWREQVWQGVGHGYPLCVKPRL